MNDPAVILAEMKLEEKKIAIAKKNLQDKIDEYGDLLFNKHVTFQVGNMRAEAIGLIKSIRYHFSG